MRTIKFRGKSCYTGKWLYGDLITYKSGEAAIANFTNFGYECSEMLCRESIDPATVGQYTGLTDKTGREIYEGDILKMGNCDFRGVVQWHKDGYFFIDEFFPKKVESDFAPLGRMLRYSMKVIGNIHDNPDMIEKGGE